MTEICCINFMISLKNNNNNNLEGSYAVSLRVACNNMSVSINIYKQVYAPNISYEISIPQAPLAVVDKPGISFCAVAQDSGTAYRVKKGQ